MVSRILSLTIPEGIRKLAGNAFSLAFLQFSNVLLSLLLLPYLIRVLGVDIYGVAAFGLSLIAFAVVVTEFGFNFFATKKIVEAENDTKAIGRIFSNVIASQTLIVVLVVVLALLALSIEASRYEEYDDYFLWLLPALVVQTYHPTWYFHGVQRMELFAAYAVLAKAMHLLLVVVIVDSAEDLELVAVSMFLANALALLISWTMVFRRVGRPPIPALADVAAYLRSSFPYFLSRGSVALYSTGGVIFLGLFGTLQQVALFSATERVYVAARAVITPLVQALYPFMTANKDLGMFVRMLLVSMAAPVVGLLISLFFGAEILVLLFGSDMVAAKESLVVFMFAFAVACPSLFFGYPLLGAFGLDRSVNFSTIAGLSAYLLVLVGILLFEQLSAVMVAAAVLITEVVIFVIRAWVAIANWEAISARYRRHHDKACEV